MVKGEESESIQAQKTQTKGREVSRFQSVIEMAMVGSLERRGMFGGWCKMEESLNLALPGRKTVGRRVGAFFPVEKGYSS